TRTNPLAYEVFSRCVVWAAVGQWVSSPGPYSFSPRVLLILFYLSPQNVFSCAKEYGGFDTERCTSWAGLDARLVAVSCAEVAFDRELFAHLVVARACSCLL